MAGQSRFNILLSCVLIAANLIVLNILFSRLVWRVDLTEDQQYTLSQVTRRLLKNLPGQVIIRGYFSRETHPKLAPLIQQIRDFAQEYESTSDGRVVVDFHDPKDDEKVEKEAFERFGVKAVPFELETKYEAGVRSAYFTLVIQHADAFVRYELNDIIKVEVKGDELQVGLKNLEYQLTRALRKVITQTDAAESIFAKAHKPLQLNLYITDPKKLKDQKPLQEYLSKRREAVLKAARQLEAKSAGKFKVVELDPTDNEQLRGELQAKFAIAPLQLGNTNFYLDALLSYEDRYVRLFIQDAPGAELSPVELKASLEAAMKKVVPGILKTVGLHTGTPFIPPQMRFQMQRRMPPDHFKAFREVLSSEYNVQPVHLDSGKPPLDVDVLILCKPRDLSDKALYAIDQYIMHGGRVLALLDKGDLMPGLKLSQISSGLDKMIERWGVRQMNKLVLDQQNIPFPLRVPYDVGGLIIERVEEIPYPFFVRIQPDGFSSKFPALADIQAVGMFWASPFEILADRPTSLTVTPIVHSTKDSWGHSDFRDVEPKPPQQGYQPSGGLGRKVLAVAIEGKFESYFKDKPIPRDKEDPSKPPAAGLPPATQPKKKETRVATVTTSPPTRVILVADSDVVSDIGMEILEHQFGQNVRFTTNLIDWFLGEEEMIQIRARTAKLRPLQKLDKWEKAHIEYTNYFIGAVLVGLLGLGRLMWRRRIGRHALKKGTFSASDKDRTGGGTA